MIWPGMIHKQLQNGGMQPESVSIIEGGLQFVPLKDLVYFLKMQDPFMT